MRFPFALLFLLGLPLGAQAPMACRLPVLAQNDSIRAETNRTSMRRTVLRRLATRADSILGRCGPVVVPPPSGLRLDLTLDVAAIYTRPTTQPFNAKLTARLDSAGTAIGDSASLTVVEGSTLAKVWWNPDTKVTEIYDAVGTGTMRVVGTLRGAADTVALAVNPGGTPPPPPPPPPPPDTIPPPPPPPPTGRVAELPRSTPQLPDLSTLPCTQTVGTGIQAAVTALAATGGVLCVTGTNSGALLVPRGASRAWLVIRSASVLPPGQRVTPATGSAYSAKFRATAAGSESAITVLRDKTVLLGLDVGVVSTLAIGPSAIIRIGSNGETSLGELPDSVLIDQVYVHGNPGQNTRRGFLLGGRTIEVRNSDASEIHDNGQDAQAVAGWNGPGPWRIDNNYLEGSGENVMIGGSDPSITGVVPKDITLTRNWFRKPAAWLMASWVIKNLFEVKAGDRVLVEHNVLEGSWAQAQTGVSINLKSSNDAACTTCYTANVSIRQNLITNVGYGMSFSPQDVLPVGAPLSKVQIDSNYFGPIDVAPYSGNGWAILLLGGTRDLSFMGNTWASNTNACIIFDAGTVTRLTWKYNACSLGQYGVKSTSGFGTVAFATGAPGAVVGPSFYFGLAQTNYPTGSVFGTTAPAGFGVSRAQADAWTAGVVQAR
jgi:hypothetical protein